MAKGICFVCKIKIEEKDTIAVNKKLLGRNIDKFFCMNCFAYYLGVTVDELIDKIEDFKEQGCTLFK